MSNDLLTLYQHIRETPALSVDLPEGSGKGRIVRLDTNTFSLSEYDVQQSYIYGRQCTEHFSFCLINQTEHLITDAGKLPEISDFRHLPCLVTGLFSVPSNVFAYDCRLCWQRAVF